MEHAYLIIHIDKLTNEIKGVGIYSEWPLTKILSDKIVDVCIFHRKAVSYVQAKNELMQELLSFPMVQSR